jgi:hypothetical protein
MSKLAIKHGLDNIVRAWTRRSVRYTQSMFMCMLALVALLVSPRAISHPAACPVAQGA